MILYYVTGMLVLFTCIASIVFKISENKEKKLWKQDFMQTAFRLRELSEHASKKTLK